MQLCDTILELVALLPLFDTILELVGHVSLYDVFLELVGLMRFCAFVQLYDCRTQEQF